jgi:hypothetical protein
LGDRSPVEPPIKSDGGAPDPAQQADKKDLESEDVIRRLRLELAAKRAEESGVDRVVDLRDAAPRRVRRIRLGWLKYVVVLALLLLTAELVYVGWTLRGTLLNTQSSLREARSAFVRGDYDSAYKDFERALAEARDASELTERPGAWVMRNAPGISSDARAVEELTSVAQLASRAGLNAVDLYDRLGVTSSGLTGAFFRDGRVRMEPLGMAQQGVDELIDLLSEADGILAGNLRPNFDSVQEAVDAARSLVDEALGELQRAETLLGAAPTLFGDEVDRQYLLLILNPGESRTTGGVISYFGVLGVSNGRLDLGSVRPISRLERRPDAWSNVNVSADFPLVARSLLSRYRERTGERLDGVLAAGPMVLQQMTRATGPVRERGLNVAVSSENASRVLMHDVFEHFGRDKFARDQYVAAVVEKIWRAVTRGVSDTSVLADALEKSVQRQHLKMYSTTVAGQKAFDELGSSGDPRLLGRDVQMMMQNSLTDFNVDFFLRRQIDTTIELKEDGSAVIQTTTTVENRAPDGPPSLSLGLKRPGEARLSLDALLPESASNVTFDGGAGYDPQPSTDVGRRPVLSVDLRVPAGSTRTTVFTYAVPASDSGGAGPSFRLVLLPQALAFPDRAAVDIVAPPGFCINSCDRPSSTRWSSIRTLNEPWTVTARLTPAAD